MLPNVGPAELLIILVLALIVFGPKKLPEVGKSVGRALREFQQAKNDFMQTVNSEVDLDDTRGGSSSRTASRPEAAPKALEYPEPPTVDSADALPYGGAFYATEGESQPTFRTDEPEEVGVAPVQVAATADAPSGEGKA
jgi:sec-independent protein translocase protein TatA